MPDEPIVPVPAPDPEPKKKDPPARLDLPPAPIVSQTDPPGYLCPVCGDKNDYRDTGLEYDEVREKVYSICPACDCETVLRTIDKPYFMDRLKAGGLA